MNSSCPHCRFLVKLDGLSKKHHYLHIDDVDRSVVVFEGSCKSCRGRIVYAFYSFCDKIFSWKKEYEATVLQKEWFDISKKHGKCLYLYGGDDLLGLLHEFRFKYKNDAFFIVNESNRTVIKECNMSYLPLIVFPNDFFAFEDMEGIPSFFAERIITCFAKDVFCSGLSYHDNFQRFSRI